MSNHIFRVEGIETDDSGDLQTLKANGYAGEELVGLHRVQPHGFASHAPKGSHGIGIAGRGERDLGLVLGLEDPKTKQKNLAEGNSVIYDASGNVSRYQGTDGIWHDAGTRPQKMTADTLTCVSTHDAIYGSKNGNTYIGGNPADGGTFSPAVTVAGPSTHVFIKL